MLPWLCAGVCVALAVPSAVLLIVGPDRPVSGDALGGVGGLSFVLVSVTYATVGAVVAARVPGNRVGWLFCATGLATALAMLVYAYGDLGVHAGGGVLPGARVAAWFPNEGLGGLFALPLVFFPDGRLPSRRWRIAVACAVGAIVLLTLGPAIRPGSLGSPLSAVANPVGVPSAGGLADAMENVGWLLALAAIAMGAGALVVRLRRADGVERTQLELVLSAGTLIAAVVALSMAGWLIWPDPHQQVRLAALGVAFAAFPVVAGVAILRYRLYDIDLFINRALVYGALTATLAAAYVGSVLLWQLVLRPSSGLAVAASTLAVAALFRPARARIQSGVDRRFYRRRYDARRTLESFAGRLRHQVDLAALDRELRAVVDQTLQPASVSLWLRPGEPGDPPRR